MYAPCYGDRRPWTRCKIRSYIVEQEQMEIHIHFQNEDVDSIISGIKKKETQTVCHLFWLHHVWQSGNILEVCITHVHRLVILSLSNEDFNNDILIVKQIAH